MLDQANFPLTCNASAVTSGVISLVYLDLDNFKSVNDQYGHPAGDQVLRTVVSCCRKYLRKTDVIARLGGDEFALLLPDTNEQSSHTLLSKLQTELLEEMGQSNWPVTVSMGVLICYVEPDMPKELVSIAEELMYSVKHAGKNVLKYFACNDAHKDPSSLASSPQGKL